MTYRPIACSIHDRLEAASTLRRTVALSFLAPDGEAQSRTEPIVDVFTREGAEYLRLASGLEVRLDRLLALDGVSMGDME